MPLFENAPIQVKFRWDHKNREAFLNDRWLSAVFAGKLVELGPPGFSVGYRSSLCDRLALAILLIYLTQTEAIAYYKAFARNVIAKLPQKDYTGYLEIRRELVNIVKESAQNSI